MRNSRFPSCNRNRENMHGPNRSHRRPYRGASTPQDRLRHSRRQTRRLRSPGPALGAQTLLRPFPASGRPRLEDPRRRSHYERGRSAVDCRANSRRDPTWRGPAPRPRRDPLRGRRRDRVRTIPAALEAGNAGCQPVLPEEPRSCPASRDGKSPTSTGGTFGNWFASLRAIPVAADRSMPVLSVIMREAEAMGLRPEGSNPCLGIRRYRRKGRARFLSDEEMRGLSARLGTAVRN